MSTPHPDDWIFKHPAYHPEAALPRAKRPGLDKDIEAHLQHMMWNTHTVKDAQWLDDLFSLKFYNPPGRIPERPATARTSKGVYHLPVYEDQPPALVLSKCSVTRAKKRKASGSSGVPSKLPRSDTGLASHHKPLPLSSYPTPSTPPSAQHSLPPPSASQVLSPPPGHSPALSSSPAEMMESKPPTPPGTDQHSDGPAESTPRRLWHAAKEVASRIDSHFDSNQGTALLKHLSAVMSVDPQLRTRLRLRNAAILRTMREYEQDIACHHQPPATNPDDLYPSCRNPYLNGRLPNCPLPYDTLTDYVKVLFNGGPPLLAAQDRLQHSSAIDIKAKQLQGHLTHWLAPVPPIDRVAMFMRRSTEGSTVCVTCNAHVYLTDTFYEHPNSDTCQSFKYLQTFKDVYLTTTGLFLTSPHRNLSDMLRASLVSARFLAGTPVAILLDSNGHFKPCAEVSQLRFNLDYVDTIQDPEEEDFSSDSSTAS